jgi:UDP-N-acetylglucosamine:LPS N-acetylglucosamine transferase
MVLDGAATMPQEVPNAQFVTGQGFGLSVGHRRQMFGAVQSLAQDPAGLAAIRRRIKAYRMADASQQIIAGMKSAMADPLAWRKLEKVLVPEAAVL